MVTGWITDRMRLSPILSVIHWHNGKQQRAEYRWWDELRHVWTPLQTKRTSWENEHENWAKSGRIFHNYFRILHISTKLQHAHTCKMLKFPSNCPSNFLNLCLSLTKCQRFRPIAQDSFFRNSCSQLVLFVYLILSRAACLPVDGNTSHAAHYCRSLTDGTNH